jgi:hypothetical protein
MGGGSEGVPKVAAKVNEMSDETANPYRAPTASDASEQPAVLSGQIRAWSRWLVFTSVVMVVLTEVFPTEVDVLYMAMRTGNISSFLKAKAVCLALILVPLVIFFWINGWRGLKAVKARIIALGVIFVLNLVLDAYCLVNYSFRSN